MYTSISIYIYLVPEAINRDVMNHARRLPMGFPPAFVVATLAVDTLRWNAIMKACAIVREA